MPGGPPIAIGGVGGSGTRVIAQILRGAGVYLGGDLNEALDNRWFTLLFKRPTWYEHSVQCAGRPFRRAVGVFAEVMHTGPAGAVRGLPVLLAAALDLSRTGHDRERFARGSWPFRRVARALTGPVPREPRWGWKEPNTHLFLPELAAALPDLRYLHVVRHGLDMAFSENQNQLFNWGHLFGLDYPEQPAERAAASLAFWVAANERAIRAGRDLLGDRFAVVNLDELWRDARSGVARLLATCDLDVDPAALDRLAQLPRQPDTIGRHRDKDLSRFAPSDLAALRRLGFRPGDPS